MTYSFSEGIVAQGVLLRQKEGLARDIFLAVDFCLELG
jgi:hypothetical protein